MHNMFSYNFRPLTGSHAYFMCLFKHDTFSYETYNLYKVTSDM